MTRLSLEHITDVGASAKNGVDSSRRIELQYRSLGVEPKIVTAGNSPLEIAFVSETTLSENARISAGKVGELLGMSLNEVAPIALNCAPRNAKKAKLEAREDFIYRVRCTAVESPTLLLYGPKVLRWVLALRGRENVQVERIISLGGIILDTSKGTQFRSAEHLPLVHIVEAYGKLDENSIREEVDLATIPDYFPQDGDLVVLPSDEYKNGRFLLNKKTFDDLFASPKVIIRDFAHMGLGELQVAHSLTEVTPGRLAVWPSSNHFLNDDLRVMNIGTRWAAGTTNTTDHNVMHLAEYLDAKIGFRTSFSFEW